MKLTVSPQPQFQGKFTNIQLKNELVGLPNVMADKRIFFDVNQVHKSEDKSPEGYLYPVHLRKLFCLTHPDAAKFHSEHLRIEISPPTNVIQRMGGACKEDNITGYSRSEVTIDITGKPSDVEVMDQVFKDYFDQIGVRYNYEA